MTNFKLARLAAGLTQIQLANLTGIPTNTIVAYEQGRWRARPERAALLAAALNVTLEYLQFEPPMQEIARAAVAAGEARVAKYRRLREAQFALELREAQAAQDAAGGGEALDL
jgi:transcriptional regulator with XRE-family HTH domain